MQNNGTIPNVSTVFRELVKISSTNPRLNTQSEVDKFRSSNNYSYGSNTYDLNRQNDNKWQESFPSSIADNDRQQRHEALMGRLRNSVNENRQLLGIQESPIQRMSNYERPNVQLSSFGNNNMYSQNDFSGFSSRTGQLRQKGTKWTPPQIKYRHIDDLQQKSTVSIQNNRPNRNSFTNKRQSIQTNLKEQFYQQNLFNQAQSLNTQNYQLRKNNKSQQNNQNDLNQYSHEDNQYDQNMNKLSIMSQKPSKYNQNIQSYYEICRKPIKTSLLTGGANRNQEKNNNTEKFMRKHVPKVEGINLEKAMKILSLDD